MLCTTLYRKIGSNLESAISALFANSEVGVWYDTSDFSTMFQDSAGTTPVTAAGQAVMYVTDLSGNGKHATQTVAVDACTSSAIGCDFDGVSDYLSIGA